MGVVALTDALKSIILDNLNQQCLKDKAGSSKWQHDLLVKFTV